MSLWWESCDLWISFWIPVNNLCTRCEFVKIREVPVDRLLSLATPLHPSTDVGVEKSHDARQPIGSQAASNNKLGFPFRVNKWLTEMTSKTANDSFESLVWSIPFLYQSYEPKMVLPFFNCFSQYQPMMGRSEMTLGLLHSLFGIPDVFSLGCFWIVHFGDSYS